MGAIIYGTPVACQRQTVPERRNHLPVESIGTRIRRLRHDAALTASALAKQAGMAYSTPMDLENGRRQ
jgi:DNA-binding XRE family transcriptional regulator